MASDYKVQQGSVQEVGLRSCSFLDLMGQGACRVTGGTLWLHGPLCTQGWSMGQEQHSAVVHSRGLGLGSRVCAGIGGHTTSVLTSYSTHSVIGVST